MGELKHDKWVGTTYGNDGMHKWLIKMLKVVDVRLIYAFASVFVVPPTMLINGKARKAIYNFYRTGFRYNKLKSLWMTYKNHCAFSQVVIDKFAMYAGKKFRISITGYEHFRSLTEQTPGFVQLSSHIGNYEIAGYSLVADKKRVNALVFGGEKAAVMMNRSKLFQKNNIRMIPMSSDMTHLFLLDEALSNGEILSMPADRIFGSQKAYSLELLGRNALFPQGPFVMAAVRNVPVLFVSVMKTGLKSYHITVSPIECPPSGNSKSKAADMARRYVELLEGTVRKHPAQWYNYFNFWEN